MSDQALRLHLLKLLDGRGAHLELSPVLTEFPPELAAARIAGVSHTPWRLLEHMRIAQWDILEFTINPSHVSPEWPEGYWPAEGQEGDAARWKESVRSFLADLDRLKEYVSDPKTDLFTPFPHGTGQTGLREALLTADHNAYHLGQIVLIRKAAEAR